ncbi:uncharacterized protein PAC_13688 [Phialocephala subalpina]|uniref:Uncharacterized protein n=1 Tax=Phialocephala subalpina TaxID=576137 RepID=A0A1L7XFI5_9HELO|nr:uncharacterized protein PAC_13688 [Phialocephala subalpina]
MLLEFAVALTFPLIPTRFFRAHNAPITSFANIKIIPSSTTVPVTSNCCFVIQDTVDEVWWEEYCVSTVISTVTITSITTFITVFPNTTLSSITSNIIFSPTTTFSTLEASLNSIRLGLNRAPGPAELTTELKDATQTVVKIITAAAVTDQNGRLACGTPFSFPAHEPFWTGRWEYILSTSITFDNIYSNAQEYWGSGIVGFDYSSRTSVFGTQTLTDWHFKGTVNTYGTYTTTYDQWYSTPLYFDSTGSLIDLSGPKQTGVTISFETPFVYLPEAAAAGLTRDSDADVSPCNYGTSSIGYGVPPQTLLNYMLSVPSINSQYPGLASCLPAGPSMLHAPYCMSILPIDEIAGGDLTSSTTIFATPGGTAPLQSPQSPTSSTSHGLLWQRLPKTIFSTLTFVPTALPDLQTTQTNAPGITATSDPATRPLPVSTSLDAGATIANAIASVMDLPPVSLSPTTVSGTPEYVITAQITKPLSPGMSISRSTTVISGTPNIVFPSIMTIPATSLPGSMTQISGTLNVVISGPTTIPLNPKLPGLSGSTKIISGSSYVIVPSATTIPVVLDPASRVLASLPGSLTEISGTLDIDRLHLQLLRCLGPLPGSLNEVSGTLEVVIIGPTTILLNSELPGLTGSTTVISGLSYVVVTGPTTVPVDLTAPPSATDAGRGDPMQVSAGSAGQKMMSVAR